MRTVKTFFDNGDFSITDINGDDESIIEYFVGKTFNIGTDGDKLVKCTHIQFLDKE